MYFAVKWIQGPVLTSHISNGPRISTLDSVQQDIVVNKLLKNILYLNWNYHWKTFWFSWIVCFGLQESSRRGQNKIRRKTNLNISFATHCKSTHYFYNQLWKVPLYPSMSIKVIFPSCNLVISYFHFITPIMFPLLDLVLFQVFRPKQTLICDSKIPTKRKRWFVSTCLNSFCLSWL